MSYILRLAPLPVFVEVEELTTLRELLLSHAKYNKNYEVVQQLTAAVECVENAIRSVVGNSERVH